MLLHVIQGEMEVIIDAKIPKESNEVLHGTLMGIIDGGYNDNLEPIVRKVAPRKFYVTGSYALIEYKGELRDN